MDMLVETVRSCNILDQIICSNAEKRYMFGKLIRNPNCRRSFYHNSNGDISLIRNIHLLQFSLGFCQEPFRLYKFL